MDLGPGALLAEGDEGSWAGRDSEFKSGAVGLASAAATALPSACKWEVASPNRSNAGLGLGCSVTLDDGVVSVVSQRYIITNYDHYDLPQNNLQNTLPILT